MAAPDRGYRRLTGAVLVAALGALVIAGCEAPLGLGDDYSKATCEDIGDSDFREDMAKDIAERVLPDSPEPLDELASRVNGRLELACSEAPGDRRPFEAVVAQSIEGPRGPARSSAGPARRRRPARKPAAPQRAERPAPEAPRPRAKPTAGRPAPATEIRKVTR